MSTYITFRVTLEEFSGWLSLTFLLAAALRQCISPGTKASYRIGEKLSLVSGLQKLKIKRHESV